MTILPFQVVEDIEESKKDILNLLTKIRNDVKSGAVIGVMIVGFDRQEQTWSKTKCGYYSQWDLIALLEKWKSEILKDFDQ